MALRERSYSSENGAFGLIKCDLGDELMKTVENLTDLVKQFLGANFEERVERHTGRRRAVRLIVQKTKVQSVQKCQQMTSGHSSYEDFRQVADSSQHDVAV